MGACALFTNVATAGVTHSLVGSFGSFQSPQAVTVDQSNGDVLVIDQSANTVERFDAAGKPASFSALGTNVIDGSGSGNCPVTPADCDETPQEGFSFSGPAQAQVAIDESGGVDNGDIYVTDTNHDVLDIFAADGHYLGQLTGTDNGGFGGVCGVAVDKAGNVYVADTNGEIHRFQPFANPVSNSNFVMDIAAPACELAVDSAGNIYASQPEGPVTKYDSAGDLQYVLDANPSYGVAVDPATDNVYVAEAAGVAQFDASSSIGPVPLGSFGAGQLGSPAGVAVSGSTNDVYVSDSTAANVAIFGPGLVVPDVTTGSASAVTDTGATLEATVNPRENATTWQFQYGTDTSYGSTAPASAQSAGSGAADVPVTTAISGLSAGTTYHFRVLATDGNGTTYGSDQTFTTQAPPAIDSESAEPVGKTTATLVAQINPFGSETTYRFEYGTSEGYGQSTPDATIAAAYEDQPASAQLTGLQANTTYHYRVVATNSLGGPVDGPDQTFTTSPALSLGHVFASALETSQATVNAEIDPLGDPTVYRFEYGPTNSYGASIPSSDAAVGSGDANIAVSQTISGLAADTTYHYRVVATNAVGSLQGADHQFHTPPVVSTTADTCPNAQRRQEQDSSFLPDCRAYEMVSPSDKNGEDVIPDAARTRAASEESSGSPMAVTFASLAAFGDTEGTSVASEYMGIRSTNPDPGNNGWELHGIFPYGEPQTPWEQFFTNRSMWEGQLSPDLTQGVFRGTTPVTAEDPNVVNVRNLYYRNNLRTDGKGSYKLITPCLTCTSPLPDDTLESWETLPELDGHSADFDQILYESRYKLAEGATAGVPNLFDWDNGVLRFAAILPDGTPAPSSVAGHGAGSINRPTINIGTISEDGSRIFFTANAQPCQLSPDAGALCGDLYMREHEGTPQATTVQLNLSEKVPAEAPQLAFFWMATPDGSHILFTSSQDLTGEGHGGPNLYMYDASKPASDPHNLTLISGPKQSSVDNVYGMGDDGRTVYFEAEGRAWVWHEGVLEPVTRGQVTSREQNTPVSSIYMEERDEARVTGDGRYFLFRSSIDPETGESIGTDCISGKGFYEVGPGPCPQLFLYSRESGKSTCVSCAPGGAETTSEADDTAWSLGGGSYTARYLNRPMSVDGTRVFFTTRAALVPQDVNGKLDAYEYNLATHEVSLLSTGQAPTDSYFLDASANGDDVFIATAQRLLGWDRDENYDLYDVRVDGGFPEPAGAPPACAGEGCQGSATAPPAALSLSSLASGGTGNVVAHVAPKKATPRHRPKPLRCKPKRVRRKVRGHVRCVVRSHATHRTRRAK